ncbi:DUF4365 domain-containing protein [Microbacterium rhizosphaerae]|uniref:DUF4365 domain-containing protein n=1 Tax=Microbacterium rhizosphaerae TaxID=1678237 RepID=A0ABZ0SNE7_9MICO|nr:DUF4365 domain-containing protein [Microbacterium rhizosphaerae]WPR89705.1 DUF4365 domain-containing protein [Microbacterium rhizosphaerae]
MSGGKKLSNSELIGDAGIALIHGKINAMGHAWRAQNLDAGIDGSIELRDPATGEMSNRHLLVQSKASNNPFPGETAERFHYICDERDLEYWMKASAPVVLICSHPKSGEAWWVHIQSYFFEPARRADRRVDFTKSTMGLAGDITGHLFAIADPEGRAHTPAPTRRPEKLTSNLISVHAPELVLSYATKARTPGEVYKAQRDSGLPFRHDFALSGGRLWTWSEVDGTSLGDQVLGFPDAHEIDAIATEDAAGERLAVRLLNNALRDDLNDDCAFDRERHLLYVRATEDLSIRKWHTGGSNSRTIFKGYPSKTDRSRISYYRHDALGWQFLHVDDTWFCAITPDYYYSWDGRRESKRSASLLANIKRLDHHAAVRQQTVMWASILCGEGNLVDAPRSRLLEFGQLQTFALDRGIDDAAWKRTTPTATAPEQPVLDLFEESE